MSVRSSDAQNAAVHLKHARIFISIIFNFYHYGQFKSASGISSGASNLAVQLEHATILFKSELFFTAMGSS
jgi:hypothetical protein